MIVLVNSLLRLLEVSVATSFLILPLCLASRRINRRYGAKWKYYIWLLLAVRLMIPFNLPTVNGFSILPDWSQRQQVQTLKQPIQPPADTGSQPETVQEQEQQAYEPSVSIDGTEEKANTQPVAILNVADIAAIAWCVGFCVFSVFQLYVYYTFRRRIFMDGSVCENNRIHEIVAQTGNAIGLRQTIPVIVSHKTNSPMIFGIFRPVLVIPREDYSSTELNMIVRHELTHCKRHDIAFKMLLTAVNALHWFNPIVYLMVHEANADIELCCDADVLRNADAVQRKAYAESILSSMAHMKGLVPVSTCFCHGSIGKMKERFENIIYTGKRRSGIVLLVAASVMSVLLGIFVSCGNDLHSETSNQSDEQIVIGWIPERSYFSDYQINQDKIQIAYSVCLFNETEDPVDISISFIFRKKDLKGWLQYESLYFAEDENGESYVTIKPMTTDNYTLYFEGTYLGGTVNKELFPDDIIMVVKDSDNIMPIVETAGLELVDIQKIPDMPYPAEGDYLTLHEALYAFNYARSRIYADMMKQSEEERGEPVYLAPYGGFAVDSRTYFGSGVPCEEWKNNHWHLPFHSETNDYEFWQSPLRPVWGIIVKPPSEVPGYTETIYVDAQTGDMYNDSKQGGYYPSPYLDRSEYARILHDERTQNQTTSTTTTAAEQNKGATKETAAEQNKGATKVTAAEQNKGTTKETAAEQNKGTTKERTSKQNTTVASSVNKEISDQELVTIRDFLPNIYIDVKYATADNFTGQIIYDFSEPSLRYGTVKKLMAVQKELNGLGYSLKVWDAYRPIEAQMKLWEICPDPAYVSDPSKGYSGHCRGNTIDVTLVTIDGKEIKMPSGYDEFSALADRDYSDVSSAAAKNAKLLESVMKKHGFKGYQAEWWHYTDTVSYRVVK